MPLQEKEIESIAKIADEIRVINNFMANDGLHGSFFGAPTTGVTKKYNILLICLSIVALLALGAVGGNVYYDFTLKLSMLLLLLYIICAGIIVVLAHLHLKNVGATVIVTFVLFTVLVIGFDILIPEEVVDLAIKLVESKNT